ncbi:MAG: hypothetical protein IPO48_09265 [Saprospiraceae bacterium]|nr:hypothetical protein [Saprospiraceae bacterium]
MSCHSLIECFDNSNLQGINPVSSCVVFKECKNRAIRIIAILMSKL